MKHPLLLFTAAVMCHAGPVRSGEGWLVIPVPGPWEQSGVPELASYDGMAWLRTWVKPHDEFFTPHERNLFEESVSLSVPGVTDAFEVFVNSVRIGGSGKFPPDAAPGTAGVQRYKIPPGTLKKGQWNEIALRVFNVSGPGGFTGEAPFLMDYFQECVLAGPWEIRTGDGPGRTGNALPEKPATTAFDTYRESSRLLGESPHPVTGPKREPADSAARMQPHPQLVSELLLSEPLVAQPTHLSFDARGRLWVSQYRQYPYPAGVTPVSRDKYYRTHYDAIPAAPPGHTRGRDVISVHGDTDGDGLYDQHQVFADGLNLANAAVSGRGGVWVMNTPHLLFYPDRDGNTVPDGPPEVRLTGFGLEDSHSVANGLIWGIDGWLYGGQGSTCSCRVTRPGIDPAGAPGAAFEGCMVWRYHPETRAFEIFAEGSGNTFGLEQDSDGRLFSGHNGGDTRGWHYVQGGFYLKQGVDPGKFGPARYPWTFGDLPMLPSSTPAARFTHLFAMGEGTALPSSFQGKLFALDPLHNVVIAASRTPQGSSFITADLGPAVQSTDTAFRPVYIVNAPDGSLFIGDFYEHYIAHGQHYQSQIDAASGRVYRLRGRDTPLEKDLNLEAKSGPALVEQLRHPNKWHRQTAVRLLGERRDPATRPQLQEQLAGGASPAAPGALWALFQAGWLTVPDATAALRHPSATVRLWATRFLGEMQGRHPGIGLPPALPSPEPPPDTAAAAALAALAATEPDAEVRAQLACTARRLPAAAGLPVIEALSRRPEDAADPFIPQLLWYALEHHTAGREALTTAFLKDTAAWRAPVISGYLLPRIMRRLCAEDRQDALHTAARLLSLAPDDAAAAPLLAGFNEAVQGRDLSAMPEDLLQALARRGGMTLPLRLRKGDPGAVIEAVAGLKTAGGREEDRLLIIRTLGEMRVAPAVPALMETAAAPAATPALRRAALAALTAFDDAAIAPALLAILPSAPPEVAAAAFSSLTSRPKWASTLLGALQSGTVSPAAVPLEIIETLRRHPDAAVAAAAARLFPPSGTAWRDTMATVEAALKQPGGNPYEGEILFSQRCAGCHKLFFKGGVIGPDLTPYQRDNLGTMLMSIINPNAEIREGFLCQIVETKDGQSLSGYLTEQTPQTVRLRGMDGQTVTLARPAIRSITPLGRSLMPEGLLDGLTGTQLRDLFAWLRQSQPISR